MRIIHTHVNRLCIKWETIFSDRRFISVTLTDEDELHDDYYDADEAEWLNPDMTWSRLSYETMRGNYARIQIVDPYEILGWPIVIRAERWTEAVSFALVVIEEAKKETERNPAPAEKLDGMH